MKRTALLIALMLVCGSLTACGKKNTEENTSSNTAVATTITTTVPFDFEETTVETEKESIDLNAENVEIDPFENFEFQVGINDQFREHFNTFIVNSGDFYDSEIGRFLSKKVGLTAVCGYVDGEPLDAKKTYPEGTVVTVTMEKTGIGDFDDYIAYAKEKGVILTRNSIDVVVNYNLDEETTTETDAE